MKRIVLASNNRGKLAELSALLAPLGFELVPQGELGVSEADEPHPTFVENALAKARHASRITGLPALADDSGLTVPALGGAPGVLSARYATLFGRPRSDEQNNACLVEQLAQLPATAAAHRAAFVCVLAAVRSADDPLPLLAQGLWWGQLVAAPRGDHGFGYDPHFYLPEHGMTSAEMTPQQKNTYSHRAQALRVLVASLRTDWGA